MAFYSNSFMCQACALRAVRSVWTYAVYLLAVLIYLSDSAPTIVNNNQVLSAVDQKRYGKVNIPVTPESGGTQQRGGIIMSAVLPGRLLSQTTWGHPSDVRPGSQWSLPAVGRESDSDILTKLQDSMFGDAEEVRQADPRPAPSKPKQRSHCTAQSKKVTVRLPEDCSYNGQQAVTFDVKSCSGQCKTSAQLQALPVGQGAQYGGGYVKHQKCRCCQAKSITYQKVTATCGGNTKRVFKVASAEGCKCKKCTV